MTIDWLFWIGGGLLGLSGLWLCYWAMFADRAKGRKRCPKCWYNMQAAENLGWKWCQDDLIEFAVVKELGVRDKENKRTSPLSREERGT